MKGISPTKKLCKRCKSPSGEDIICQTCKSDLLVNYEASLDWQTAFDIEKAQLTAMRYSHSHENEESDLYY